MASDQVTQTGGAASSQPTALEPISPVKRKRLQTCFDHGTALMNAPGKYDFDYANDMLTQCVVHDPGNLIYVEKFLENLQRKHNNNKRGGGGAPSRGTFKKAVQAKDWVEVLKQGPAFLKSNPWDVATLRPMAEACAALGFNDIELRYLKNALDANTKDIEVNKHCATTLARVGQFDQAIGCWRRISELRRSDPEPERMIGDLTLMKARVLGGLGDESATGQQTLRPVATNAPAPAAKADPAKAAAATQAAEDSANRRRELKLTPRQQLEREIAEDPAVVANYVKLAELHTLDDRHAEAEQVLTKALAVSGGDLKVREKLEDAMLRRMHLQVAVAEKRAAVENTEESANLVRQLRDEFNRREMEVYSGRVQRYPQDCGVKLEFGIRLKRAGNYTEAQKLLIEAREDARHKPLATLELGECMQQEKQYKQSLQCYLRAAELAENDVSLKKLALYRAGVLAAGLKSNDVAEKCLKKLASLDNSYRDVQARLDKLAQLRHKG